MKIILVTGATSGIGKQISLLLSLKPVKLILIGRSQDKIDALKEEFRLSNFEHTFYTCDLSSFSRVKELCEKIKQEQPPIDCLINNAGGIFSERMENDSGVEYTLALNHYAYFALTLQLFEHLSSCCQIINVSSNSHKLDGFDLGDLNWRKRKYSGIKAYTASKLCNLLFSYQLANRLKRTKMTVNCLCPGPVASDFSQKNGGWLSFIYKYFSWFMRTPRQAAKDVVKIIYSEEFKRRTGTYQVQGKIKQSSEKSYRSKLAEKLWQQSLQQLDLDDPIPNDSIRIEAKKNKPG